MSAPMKLSVILLLVLVACKTPAAAAAEKPADSAAPKIDQSAVVSMLIKKHGEPARARAERGVRQVAAYWRAQDGDLAKFVEESFVPEPQQKALLDRFSLAMEQIEG